MHQKLSQSTAPQASSITDMAYTPLKTGVEQSILFGDQTPTFQFPHGKGYYAAYELTETGQPRLVKVKTYLSASYLPSASILVPNLLVLDKDKQQIWLNTHAMNGGMDDYLLAMWSGRADVTQNRAYDGRTESEKDRLKNIVMEIDHKSPPTALALFSNRLPVPLPSLGVSREGVADFTGIGFCVHNFAQTPCTKAGECITCKEHVCMKGLPDTLENLEQMELLIAEQLESAKAAATDLTFGADRWVTHLGWKLVHIRTIIENLKNPDVPNGSIIRIPVAHDPSPTRRALNAKGQITELNSISIDNNQIELQMKLLGSLDA
jgi:hypothetical protein